ncbi:MAG: efflux transporter periplasmic adaptor subunit [Fusobacteriales bacterium]|nr:MAG: efflux transporter periplasmic adaptor subunit [Fusobacteriales bacterium]
MNKKKFLKILCVASILFLISCGKEEKKEVIRPVKIEEVKTNGSEKLVLDFPSKVSATNETRLAFKHSGTIKKINFEKGTFVKKGEVIALLDEEDYKLNLEVFSKKYDSAKAMANNAKLQFARAEKLYKAKALSKKDYDDIVAKKTVAISMFKEATAGLKNAKNTLRETKLVAPYDGYIDKKLVDVGSVVNAGFPVVSFISDNISDIKINVSLKDIKNLENAEKIIFKVDRAEEKKNKEYLLKIKNISQTPDITKLTYPVTLTFKEIGATAETSSPVALDGVASPHNPDKKNKNLEEKKDVATEQTSSHIFSAGETGTVKVEVKRELGTDILLPLSAIFEKDKETNVYLFKDSVAVKTKVKIGNLTQDNKIIILEGLKNGDKVITAGISKLADGTKVRELKEKK